MVTGTQIIFTDCGTYVNVFSDKRMIHRLNAIQFEHISNWLELRIYNSDRFNLLVQGMVS